MARRILWVLLAVATTSAAGRAHATARYVGTCVKAPHVYPTISAAVSASAPNDRINVCPGTYPEQVTISIPLFLAGTEVFTATGAQDRAVITLPANPTITVTSQFSGDTFVPQILVQNVKSAGNFGVDIGNLTVDGSANPAGQPFFCQGVGLSAGLVGIFYDATGSASGTVVRISDVTTRNQQTQNVGCGYGIWVENDGPTNQSVTIEHNSVHDFDLGGITAVTGPLGAPPALTATITGNFVHSVIVCSECLPYGIEAEAVDGAVEGNIVSGGPGNGIINSLSTISITNNTVADLTLGTGIMVGAGSTASSNFVTNVGTAFGLNGNSNPGPRITSNTTKNTQTALAFGCTPNATATSNTFSDAATGFSNVPGTAPLASNSLFNIDTITSGACP
jgi:hypothetical protein